MATETSARGIWLLWLSPLTLAVACSADDPRKNEPPSTEQAVEILDCTEVDGRPEYLPADGDERYYPEVIRDFLKNDEVLRERLGRDEVDNCAQAREFMALYREDAERIQEKFLEEHPQEPEDDVLPAEEDELTGDEPPQDTSAGAAGAGSDGADALAGAAGAGSHSADTADSATNIQKVSNGINTAYPWVVKIRYNNTYCSATIISSKDLLTAAHCIPGSGYYLVEVQQQLTSGGAPVTMFGGGTFMHFTNNLFYTGHGDWMNDVSVGTLYLSSFQSFPEAARARLWTGSISAGTSVYYFGHGEITPGGGDPGHLHYGTGSVGDVQYSFFTADPNTSSPQVICPGDSGGPTGRWHGNFMQYGVNSHSYCGGFWKSWLTRVNYNMWHIEAIVGACTTYSVGGETYKRCW